MVGGSEGGLEATVILALAFFVHSGMAQSVPNKGLNVSTTIVIPTEVPKNSAITDCTIKDCMKFFIEPDKMKIEFNIQNIADYYIDANITAEYNNKTVKICTLPFWKPSNDKRCKVVKNSTSGDFSIIVSNATPFKKLESKVMLKFYKTGHCIQDNKDHYVTVEAVYGGEVTTKQPPSITGSGHTKVKGRAKGRTISPTTLQSTEETTKDNTQSSGTSKKIVCSSLMAAFILGSLY